MMATLPPPPAASARSLTNLAEVTLDARHRFIADLALAALNGPATWVHRIRAEITEVLSLAQLSGRFEVEFADTATDLRLAIVLHAPVPCLPDPTSPLQIADRALLGLTYRREALSRPQPGMRFVQILQPASVWHPNVAFGPVQPLCLGPSLAAGIRLKELLFASYGALTLQSVQFDPGDPAGVLNVAAAKWYQANPHVIPLTREPFLKPEVKL